MLEEAEADEEFGKAETNPGGTDVVVVQGNSVDWIDVSWRENNRKRVNDLAYLAPFMKTSFGPS
jgi:hypothetical protein